jgi:hypothetical protein
VWYGLAKVLEAGDEAVYALTGGWVSGHSIKHLLASGAVFAIWRQLWLRGARSAPTLAQPT